MSLVRLRLITPRLACRALSSRGGATPESTGTPQPDPSKPKTTLDFLELLTIEPNSLPSTSGAALRSERYNQPEEDGLTRPLRRGDTDQVYRLHVKSTNNNTLITLIDPQGGALKGGSASGGTVGFKGVGRSGYEAGYQCALRIFDRIAQLKKTVNWAHGELKLELCLNGMFGQGREAMFRALMTQDGEHVRTLISRITDTTPIRVGGTRAKKKRIL
ncbi:hypothetical protein FRC08_001444 [Ceratobasidium sp. 394]|nr:hypothetical protein FRC08_001444 [Ceratobasidium sp. 394]KAG9079367.1 hypothetical protein FS749_008577 [Ceratobasidium sp. UAMH 11750]